MSGAGTFAGDIRWCVDPDEAADVAPFFVAHASHSYISHSELQFGRATAPDRWSDDLEATVARDARSAAANGAADAPAGQRLAVARTDDGLVALAFVTFAPDAPTPFAILDDLLVSPLARGQGLGRVMLDWVAAACRSRGLQRLFLESGADNDRAHHFFEAQGFAQVSIVMMRDL